MRTHQNPLLLSALLLGGCASSSTWNTVVSGDDVHSLVRHGRFEEAVRAAKRLTEENPDDELALEMHRDASVAYLIHQGRTAALSAAA